jgi:plasmid stabilization system protein ParE
LPVLRYPYLIYYRVAEDELLILHIRHTSRRPIDPATDL